MRSIGLGNDRKVKSVDRIFKSAFGFIPKSDLVGWGYTDSPFFRDGEKQKLFNEPKAEKISHDRTLFGDHSWVYLRLQNTGCSLTDVVALDACAGPASDTSLSLEGYLKEHIDVDATKNTEYINWYLTLKKRTDSEKAAWSNWDNMNHKLFDGIISTEGRYYSCHYSPL